MEFIQPATEFVRIVAPKFVTVFGVAVGIIEFVIRDTAKEKIRDFFIRSWLWLSRMADISLRATLHSRRGRGILLVIAAVLMALGNLLILLAGIPQNNAGAYWAIQTGVFVLGALVFWLLRRRINAYLDWSLEAKNQFHTFARLLLGPISYILLFILLILTKYFLEGPLFHAVMFLLALCAFSINYIHCIWIVYTGFLLMYLIFRPLFVATELTCLRVAESQRGPVIAIAVLLAVLGVGLDHLLPRAS